MRTLIFLALLLGSAHAEPLTAFEAKSGLFGYRNAAGATVIEPKFAMAMEFSKTGLAAVVDPDKGWMIIDSTGAHRFSPYIFDNGPDPFVEGVARFVKDGKTGFYDRSGKVVIPARFDFADTFEKGRASFCIGCVIKREGEHRRYVGGHWGFINRQPKAQR